MKLATSTAWFPMYVRATSTVEVEVSITEGWRTKALSRRGNA